MSQIHYITGAAGTGKTYELANALSRWLDHNTLSDQQKILALTKMHGSRKRLNERLASKSIHTQINISTVDSFALRIVNRWRLSFGYNSQIIPTYADGGFIKDELGYRATFDEIMRLAGTITESPIVCKTVANSFPLILIDEFQDCIGFQLSFISNFKNYVDLIIAADPFQSLDNNESSCEWAEGFTGHEFVEITRLTQPQRTNNKYIQDAADALRENRQAVYRNNYLPFVITPTYDLAPWQVIPSKFSPIENAALIYPVHNIYKLLENSVNRQNYNRVNKGRKQINFPWIQRLRDAEIEQKMLSNFNNAIQQGLSKENKKWFLLYKQACYLAKIKGYDVPENWILEYVIKMFVQEGKYVNSQPIRYEATTIHGAKNREFDHVFILWHDDQCANFSDEKKRRLLYNAITRAKKTCKVIAIGNQRKILSSSVFSLLSNPISS